MRQQLSNYVAVGPIISIDVGSMVIEFVGVFKTQRLNKLFLTHDNLDFKTGDVVVVYFSITHVKGDTLYGQAHKARTMGED